MSNSDAQVLDKMSAAMNETTVESANHPVECPLCGSSEVIHFLSAPDRFHLRREIYHLLRCASCSGVWLPNPPQPGEMGIHYDEDYHRAIMAGGEMAPALRWRRHRELISRYKQGGALLDIGCSSGAFLGTMKSASWKLYGIDMETTTAERARAATGAEVFVGDVDEAPFAPDSFDVITAFDLLEHVYHPRIFLEHVRQWLKPGGIFCTMLPNIDCWESRMFGSYWYGLELPRHLFHFSPRSLRRTMTSLGFQEVFLSTADATYVERSMGYIYSEVLERAGFSPLPASKATRRGVVLRGLRKLMRVTVVNPAGKLASVAGRGASIEAIFTKAASSQGPVPERQV